MIVPIVVQALGTQAAISIIRMVAEAWPSAVRAKFIDAVETERLGLHEGTFAHYRIGPSEFKNWKNAWEG